MPRNRNGLTRRRFLQGSMVAGTGATLSTEAPAVATGGRILGANDRLRLGFIGVGNRGTQLLRAFMSLDDVEVVGLCDVYQPYLLRDNSKVDLRLARALGERMPDMSEEFGPNVIRTQDFRRLLDQDDIDAVVIATPDHWHALQTTMACEAGKHVYVEKPLSMTVVEGRRMVEAARRNDRVVQVGLQRRSSTLYSQVVSRVRGGRIGHVTVARAYRISNMYPGGIGRVRDSQPPAGLDWDMWLGPRPWRAYRDNIPLYKFRWWKQYSSQVANWGVHYFDAIRWMLNEEAPVSVSAHGGKFAVDDDRTIPDTMEVIFEFESGRLLIFGQYEASGGPALGERGEIELRGTKANLHCSSSAYRMTPCIEGQFQEPGPQMETLEVKGTQPDPTTAHARNFADCVRSKQTCNCDAETGHRSNTFALLANIALETRSRLEWDPEGERILNHEEANQLLHYEYRKPWRLP